MNKTVIIGHQAVSLVAIESIDLIEKYHYTTEDFKYFKLFGKVFKFPWGDIHHTEWIMKVRGVSGHVYTQYFQTEESAERERKVIINMLNGL